MIRDRHPRPSEIVVPVHPPEIPRVGTLRISITDRPGVIERRRIRELRELRQTDAALTETSRRIRDGRLVNDSVGQTELILQGIGGVDQRHLDSLSKEPRNRHEPNNTAH